jgi:hypothetical protein
VHVSFRFFPRFGLPTGVLSLCRILYVCGLARILVWCMLSMRVCLGPVYVCSFFFMCMICSFVYLPFFNARMLAWMYMNCACMLSFVYTWCHRCILVWFMLCMLICIGPAYVFFFLCVWFAPLCSFLCLPFDVFECIWCVPVCSHSYVYECHDPICAVCAIMYICMYAYGSGPYAHTFICMPWYVCIRMYTMWAGMASPMHMACASRLRSMCRACAGMSIPMYWACACMHIWLP